MATPPSYAEGKHDFALDHPTQQDHTPEISQDMVASSDLEIGQRATNISLSQVAHLPQEHQDYLIRRHGTLDLDPVPSADPADPYNWPEWKKLSNLMCVAFHAMISHFIAAAIIPAYENIAEDFSISITKASYLTSLQIAIVGFAPLFWKPISNRYGRRPVWLISTLGSALLNVGCAFSDSYSTMAVCRAFVAFFISPPVGIGSGVVTETYFKKQRGQFMGLWTLLLTLGPPLGPFVMGFVVTQTGNYRWIYRVLAIINGVQFLFALFLQPETLYIRKGVQHVGSAFKQEYLTFGRLDPKPLKMYEFIQPLSLFKYPSILIPTIAYSMVFGFCSVLLTVEIPQLFIPKFGFNAQQIGLQFLGIIIGSLIGEQIGGRLSDFWMHRKAKQMAYHAPPPPEHRLWLSYFGFVLAMVGLIVFGVRFQQLPAHQYDVSPIVGIAISAVGNQIVTTVSTTYAIDCHFEHSASIGIFINVIRSTWAFIGPFWYPSMLSSLGGSGSGGLMAGLIFLFSIIPMAIVQWKGKQWRRRSTQGKISSPLPQSQSSSSEPAAAAAAEKDFIMRNEETKKEGL